MKQQHNNNGAHVTPEGYSTILYPDSTANLWLRSVDSAT